MIYSSTTSNIFPSKALKDEWEEPFSKQEIEMIKGMFQEIDNFQFRRGASNATKNEITSPKNGIFTI